MHTRIAPACCLLTILGACANATRPTGNPPTDHEPTRAVGEADNGRAEYLSNLAPMWVNTFTDGSWGFGNRGFVGSRHKDQLHRITVNGRSMPHSLGAHPRASGTSHVVYSLQKRYRGLFGAVGISDVESPVRPTLTFEILGDGRRLWCSTPVYRPGRLVEFGVDVRDIDVLELVVHCPGPNHAAHAVWVEPRLQRDATWRR